MFAPTGGDPLLTKRQQEIWEFLVQYVDAHGYPPTVRGDSMNDAGILEGDYVVVRGQHDARDGDIVVALVGEDESADEATVKRFFRENGSVRLQPENAAYEPIRAAHVEILGKVIGV